MRHIIQLGTCQREDTGNLPVAAPVSPNDAASRGDVRLAAECLQVSWDGSDRGAKGLSIGWPFFDVTATEHQALRAAASRSAKCSRDFAGRVQVGRAESPRPRRRVSDAESTARIEAYAAAYVGAFL